jgi:hypothetical protein
MSKHETAARPLITVCVVTYNHEHLVEDCLFGVLAQAVDADIEILVGDDASTDGTVEAINRIALRFPGRIRLIARERNIGPSRNLQELVSQARGEFISHVDGDDFWLPGKLQTQLAVLQADESLVAVYSNAMVVTVDKRPVGVFCGANPTSFDTHYLLERGNFLCHSSLLYRSSAREAILSIGEPFIDYRIHLRLSRRGRLGFANAVLVGYRLAVPGSMTMAIPERVRRMYLQALLEAAATDGPSAGIRSAFSHFIAAELANALLLRPGARLPWPDAVRSACPGRIVPIVARALPRTARLMALAISQRILRDRAGTRLHVLFPR